MNITFKHGQELLTDGLIARAEKKLGKLSRFIHEETDEALVSLTLERESGSQTSEKMWHAVLNVDHAAEHYTAESTKSAPEDSVDAVIKELKQELKRAHGKREREMRKGGSMIKRLMRGFPRR